MPKFERTESDKTTMTEREKRGLIALPIILLVAGFLAFAGSQGSVVVSGIPLFALGVAIAFVIQWIAFVPAYLMQTEKFFDLTGSITYISVTILAVALTPLVDIRTLILMVVVLIWAFRLGTFLFRRIMKDGSDGRFDAIKPSPIRFFVTWTLQGLWVSFTLAAALAAISSATRVEIGIFAIVGLAVWIIGFGFEVIADHQKSQFRSQPENKGKFITTGLWAWSRHPNYFGEIVLWVGVAIIAFPVLSGWQYLTLLSPVFVFILLTRISGIPMLEKRADDKWGGEPAYETYKRNTPVLFPKPPSG